MEAWTLKLYGLGTRDLDKALRLVNAKPSQPDACDRLAAWLRPQLEEKMIPSKMDDDAITRWVLNFQAVQSAVFDDWHDALVSERARRRGQKVTTKTAFCPLCGGRLEVLFGDETCIGGHCLDSGARMPTGQSAMFFGNQLGRKGGTDNGLVSTRTHWFCAGCGERLKSHASTSDPGWFTITTKCSCEHLITGNTLAELAKAMDRRHDRGSPAVEAPERPDPEKLDLVALASKGDIDTLRNIADGSSETENDAIAYKWLCVAADFGHRKASAAAKHLLEVSSLRYDDEGLIVASVHRELADAYANGTDGLPRDAAKARKHAKRA